MILEILYLVSGIIGFIISSVLISTIFSYYFNICNLSFLRLIIYRSKKRTKKQRRVGNEFYIINYRNFSQQQVTNHQPRWWFDVDPTESMLLFRLKAV